MVLLSACGVVFLCGALVGDLVLMLLCFFFCSIACMVYRIYIVLHRPQTVAIYLVVNPRLRNPSGQFGGFRHSRHRAFVLVDSSHVPQRILIHSIISSQSPHPFQSISPVLPPYFPIPPHPLSIFWREELSSERKAWIRFCRWICARW